MDIGVYQIDNIYNEDSYKAIKNIPDKSIDLIIIDPPYLFESTGGGGAFGKGRQRFHDDLEPLSNGINHLILHELCRVMKKTNIYIFCNQKQVYQYLVYFHYIKKCNFDILTWHKLNPIPMCNNKYLSDTEYILFFREKGVPIYGSFSTKSKYYITSKNIKDKRKYGHPTIKPEEIINNFIVNSSKENDLVADFFLGSGTTAAVSKKLNRHYLGFEINPTYFNTAKKRLEEVEIDENKI